MSSTISECIPSFLDFVHCTICHRSLGASFSGTSTDRQTQITVEEPFWIGECFHILCHREITGGQPHDHKPLPNEIQAHCPKCSAAVYMKQLLMDLGDQARQVPDPTHRYLRPFDTSIGELMDAYNFQFKHMSDLISHLKGKLLEQKRILGAIKKDLERSWSLQRDLDAVRKENRGLKEEIKTLRLHPLKVEHGSSATKPASHLHGNEAAGTDRAYLSPSLGPFGFQLSQPGGQRPVSQASYPRAQLNTTPNEGNFQGPRPWTQTSACGSDIFAFKPPPLPFRSIAPTTFTARASIRESSQVSSSAVPHARAHPYDPHNAQGRSVRAELGRPQRQSLHLTPNHQVVRPSSRASVQAFQDQPSFPPPMRRTEKPQLSQVQTHSWRSVPKRVPPRASLASFQRPHAHTADEGPVGHDQSMS